MNILIYGFVGAISGLYSSCWGAYKDCLFEEFRFIKFIRSILIGFVLGILLVLFLKVNSISNVNLAVFFLFTMSFERLFTESFKAFIRNENQNKYKIPSKLHFFGGTVENKLLRLFVGIIFISTAFLLFYLPVFIRIKKEILFGGMFWGATAGLFGSALGGHGKTLLLRGSIR